MKKRRFHVIKYADPILGRTTHHYYILYITNMVNFERLQGDLDPSRAKLLKIFDKRDEAVAFRNAMDLL